VVPVLIFVLLIIIFIVKRSGNKDIIDQKVKTDSDKANAKNAYKVYQNDTTEKILFYLTIISLIVIILCHFLNIDHYIRDYISADFIERRKVSEFNLLYYLLPCYLFITRLIIIEVRVGDFLYKYFNVEEPELKENIIKTLLIKKKPIENNELKTIENTEILDVETPTIKENKEEK